MPLEHRVDVLIVGAGPAGLMCANALAMAGTNVRIIDKRPTNVVIGQADGIQPRTIEVLQSYGLAERVIREGCHSHMCSFYNPGRDGKIERTARVTSVTPQSSARYPFVITLYQGVIEANFLESLKGHGVEVERPRQPVDITISEDVDELSSPSSYPVKVTIQHIDAMEEEGRTEIVYAKFVVGADGAHSWVRKAFGIEMEGEQTDYIWGVVDIIPETNFPDIRIPTAIHSENGSCLVIPREGDLVRFYTQLSDADILDPLTGRVDRDRMTPQKLISVSRKILEPFQLAEPETINWWTIYIVGQRLATTYSIKDRVFIAGDACHTHSPKAGQGMNASINDTHNLAWKLVQVLRGWCNPLLLKTYEHERRRYAQELIDFDKKYAALFSGKPRTAENEDGVSHEEFFNSIQPFTGLLTGIGVQYSQSVIVDPKHQKRASNIIVGKRMPFHLFVRAADIRPVELHDLLPADVRFKVLFFTGNLSASRVAELELLAEELNQPSSFLRKFSPEGNISTVFDLITIASGNKVDIEYTLVPSFFRPHWSKVLLDDGDVTGRGAYEQFGIDPKLVTLVIIRPDGHVGAVAPSTAIVDLDRYFGSFMFPRSTLV